MSERDFEEDQDEGNYDDDLSIRTDSEGDEENDSEDEMGGFQPVSGDGFKSRRGYTKAKKEDYITSSFLTKYEKARILGTRALQLSKNAPPMVVPQPGETDPYKLAERELAERKIPFIVRRYLPDYTYEDWKLSELTY